MVEIKENIGVRLNKYQREHIRKADIRTTSVYLRLIMDDVQEIYDQIFSPDDAPHDREQILKT